jgi:hypothetical protein
VLSGHAVQLTCHQVERPNADWHVRTAVSVSFHIVGSFGSAFWRIHYKNDCMLGTCWGQSVESGWRPGHLSTRADVTFGRPSTTEDHVYAPASYTVLESLCALWYFQLNICFMFRRAHPEHTCLGN